MYKMGLVLNNLQWLICYENKPNQRYLMPDLDGGAIFCPNRTPSHTTEFD